jgi:hypothetical protein
MAGPTILAAMTCEHNNHQFTINPCTPYGMPCKPLRIGIFVFVAKLCCLCTRCKFRTTRSISIHLSSLVKIQLLRIKPTFFIIEKWIINVEFAKENNSSTWRNLRMKIPPIDLRMKIPPIDSDFIQIQIFQPWIAWQNISDTSECLLVSNWSRITKRNSKRIYCCWDNPNCRVKRADQWHAGCLENHRLRFARQTVLSLCRWSRVLTWFGKSKRDSKSVSGRRENWDLLCSCAVQERRDPLKNANFDSFESRFDKFDFLARHAKTKWTAKNILQRESKFAFSSGSLLSCTAHKHSKSQFSRQYDMHKQSGVLVDGQKHSSVWIRVSKFESDPHLQNSVLQLSRQSTTIFRAPFRDSEWKSNHCMRTSVETIPLLESGPSDLNQNLLTNRQVWITCDQSRVSAW